MELLQSGWNLVWSTLVSLWGLLEAASLFVWDFLVAFHVDYPRLEGLVIGITLTWLMMRRDRHPLIRAISSPLKLIIDILDLVWDHCCAFFGDIREWIEAQLLKAKNAIKGCLGWCKDKVVNTWSWCISKLKSVRDRLRKKKDEDQENDA